MVIKAVKLTTLTPVQVPTATITSTKIVVIVYPDMPGMVRMTTDVNVLKVKAQKLYQKGANYFLAGYDRYDNHKLG